jgi:hypothetical protein
MHEIRVPAEEDRMAYDCLDGRGEVAALMRSMDWSKTPIGPLKSWSPTFGMLLKLLLVNRFQLFLWWGPHFCQIYNDASLPSLGKKHPKSMGQPASECWAEIWHIIGPLIETPYRGVVVSVLRKRRTLPFSASRAWMLARMNISLNVLLRGTPGPRGCSFEDGACSN